MKKINMIMVLVLAIILSLMFGINERSLADNEQIKVLINGNIVTFPDAAPVIEENRVLVPIRFIAENLGADVGWDAQNQTVSIRKNTDTITLRIGEDRALINNVEKPLDVTTKGINGRTFVPLRFVGETLGASFRWLPDTKTVEISNKYFGFCYGPYRKGQNSDKGNYPTKDEISEDLAFISKFSRSIRTYGNAGSLFDIPELANKFGLDCYVGVWLGKDKCENDREIERAIKQANSGSPNIKGIIVGNEVILRNDLNVVELIDYINKIKGSTSIPVGTADIYGSFLSHPELVERIDFMMIHIHPYWESIAAEDGPSKVFETYEYIKSIYPNKYIIIGETGFPSGGQTRNSAEPSYTNQVEFFKIFTETANKNNIPYFYFDVFDEDWKANTGEGDAGAHWGVYKADGSLKPGFSGLLPSGFYRTPSIITPLLVNVPLVVYDDCTTDNAFKPTGYMGDFINETGVSTVDPINRNYTENPQSGKSCVQIKYSAPGKHGWAGVYWQYPINNWGERPGYKIVGASKLTFWARGENGGERVEFKVGGITGKENDSISPAISTGLIELSDDWKQYSIDLRQRDLSNIIGGFCVVFDSKLNPGGPTIYIDNIKYE